MSDIEWADLASENQRLRERVAELEARASALMLGEHAACCKGTFREDKGRVYNCTCKNCPMRAQRDAALAQVAELEAEKAHILQGLAESTKKRLDALAQIAVLREALVEVEAHWAAGNFTRNPSLWSLIRTALASTPEPDILRRVAVLVRSEASDAVRDADDGVPLNCLADDLDDLDLDAIIKEATRG